MLVTADAAPAMLGASDDLNALYNMGEGYIQKKGGPVAVYERLSVGKPQQTVAWEGRRRPGIDSSAS
jgi:hypothetical protein